MNHTLKSLTVAGAALFAVGSMSPADAATNQAILTVNATVTNNCDVLTQPATLTMSLNTIQPIRTLGTSSFTYACTNGASVSVTPTSEYNYGCCDFEAQYNGNDLIFSLYNDLACATNELSPGTSESLSAGTGSSQTYDICGIPYSGQAVGPLPAGMYTDTVTFTFNFGP
jgi:spore coat protein U-like protein